MASAEEEWEALNRQSVSGSVSENAWNSLKPTPEVPSFWDGAVAQIKEELDVPTPAKAGASLVHTIFQTAKVGEVEWEKIEPPTSTAKPAEKKPIIPEPVKEVVKLLGTFVAAAAGAAVANAAEKIRSKKANPQTGLVPYAGSASDNEVIDVVATDVKE
ncbi:hypothetical protein KBD75_02385 [Candidatus Woesebacteria bacterium]|nr:hypothetical protein [Candidatus Woesebacteria bacterium]